MPKGVVMDRVRYPEKAQRESMLWDVYEWFQEQTDYSPRLRYYQVVSMGIPLGTDTETAEGVQVDIAAVERQNTQQLNRFIRLVNEGYIDADLKREFVGGPPFTSAIVRGLTERGLIFIGELPDPQQRLIQGLEANIGRIEEDTSLPNERKKYLAAAGRQAVEFVREVGSQGGGDHTVRRMSPRSRRR